MLPGPVSKAITRSVLVFGGIAVKIRDAANVDGYTPASAMPHQHVVQIRNQRRALAARRHVAFPEIRDDIDARALADNAGFADLKRARDFLPEILRSLSLVENSLPVAADQLDGVQAECRLARLSLPTPRRIILRVGNSAAKYRPCGALRIGNGEKRFTDFLGIRD